MFLLLFIVHRFQLIYLFLLILQNGDICVWKGSTETNPPFYPAATLKGHTGAVVCLTVGRNRLYSGSVDHTIKVSLWHLQTSFVSFYYMSSPLFTREGAK